jgi:beta-glucanase (GH16 family)
MRRRPQSFLVVFGPVAVAVLAILATVIPAGVAASRAHEAGPRDRGIGRAHISTGRAHWISHRRSAVSRVVNRVVTRSPSDGSTVSGRVTWQVDVSGAYAKRVDFLIDGALKWSQAASPYLYGGGNEALDTTRLPDGAHSMTAVAYGTTGARLASSQVKVNVANSSGPPSGNGTLLFSDDFNGAAGTAPDPAKWVAMNWCDYWGSLECNTNRSQNVALDGAGNLRVRAIRESWTDAGGRTGSWTSARLETQRNFSFTYGTVKARIKVPAGRGFWPSFWTNAASRTGWPGSGEIDVMELLGNDPQTYYCSVHGGNSSGQHAWQTIGYHSPQSLAADFHVYEARWIPGQVDFFVDGNRCGTISTGAMQTFTPQQVLVGMAVGGSWPGNPDATTPSSADMLVDWVQVYAG